MRARPRRVVQRTGDGIQHAVGDSGEVAAFQSGVVVGADPGQHGYFSRRAGDAPPAVGGQAGLLGGDPGPWGGQELPYLVPAVHTRQATVAPRVGWGGPPVHG